ncbi:MAG: MBL fold metallo-hydrolase RNA specificity domain-containing protein, partial [Anaerolineae bacterium]
FQKRPSQTFIVHGEPESAFAFADSLRKEQSLQNIHVPELGQGFSV